MRQAAHEDDLRIASLQQAYRGGALRPRQLIARLRARAAALNPEFRLFIRLLDEAELEPYLAALEARPAQELPLYGIPFAIKDNIDLAGVPTTAACPAFAYTPQRSASVVERLATALPASSPSTSAWPASRSVPTPRDPGACRRR